MSNGHGEDTVGAALAAQVRELAGSQAEIVAWPIVGLGAAYSAADIAVVGPRRELPSGGLGYLNPTLILHDVVVGGLGLVLRQFAFAWHNKETFDGVVGVGDRVTLLVNHYILKRPMVWVAIADSVRYLPAGREVGNPRMWRAMRSPTCRAVFARDPETRDSLKRLGIGAEYVGNPMMDLVGPEGSRSARGASCLSDLLRSAGVPDEGPFVVLLPGSRDDAYLNLADQLEAFRSLVQLTGGKVRAAVAWAPGLQIGKLAGPLAEAGWRFETIAHRPRAWVGSARWEGNGATAASPHPVPLLVGLFGDLVRKADVVIGQAGTAVEQAAGLGKPVITFPGRGSQVPLRFLRGQQQMLGEAIMIVERHPDRVAEAVLKVLTDRNLKERMAAAGRQRMGPPGALRIIAHRIVEELIAWPVKTERVM